MVFVGFWVLGFGFFFFFFLCVCVCVFFFFFGGRGGVVGGCVGFCVVFVVFVDFLLVVVVFCWFLLGFVGFLLGVNTRTHNLHILKPGQSCQLSYACLVLHSTHDSSSLAQDKQLAKHVTIHAQPIFLTGHPTW